MNPALSRVEHCPCVLNAKLCPSMLRTVHSWWVSVDSQHRHCDSNPKRRAAIVAATGRPGLQSARYLAPVASEYTTELFSHARKFDLPYMRLSMSLQISPTNLGGGGASRWIWGARWVHCHFHPIARLRSPRAVLDHAVQQDCHTGTDFIFDCRLRSRRLSFLPGSHLYIFPRSTSSFSKHENIKDGYIPPSWAAYIGSAVLSRAMTSGSWLTAPSLPSHPS